MKYIFPGSKTLRQYQLAIKSRVKHPRIYKMTTNNLMQERTAAPRYICMGSLVSATVPKLGRIGQHHFKIDLSNQIAHGFVEILASHKFGTDNLLFEYIRQNRQYIY